MTMERHDFDSVIVGLSKAITPAVNQVVETNSDESKNFDSQKGFDFCVMDTNRKGGKESQV